MRRGLLLLSAPFLLAPVCGPETPDVVDDLPDCLGNTGSGDWDDDGVCDNIDACPNTHPDDEVDNAGCPVEPTGDTDDTDDTDPTNDSDDTGTEDSDDTDVPIGNKADILWVVDNSGSMALKQARLKFAASTYIQALDASGVDYHLAVTTTDVTGSGAQGALATYDGRSWIDATTSDRVAAFEALADRGDTGSADEFGSYAAYLAIEPSTGAQPSANIGFRRDDAALHLVVLTDEGDLSFTQHSALTLSVVDYVAWLEAKTWDQLAVSFSAIAGPVPGGCEGPGGLLDDADPGTPYNQIQANVPLGDGLGLFFNICADDYTQYVTELAAVHTTVARP